MEDCCKRLIRKEEEKGGKVFLSLSFGSSGQLQ